MEIVKPKYERRIVCFFDILGWKDHIDRAGDDPEELERLALFPSIMTSELVKEKSSSTHRLTAFSDCVVVSCLESQTDLMNYIQGLSKIFLAAATYGLFMRAGVTIDNIYHDDRIVFGPALNRAHYLESTGDYPRIILDDSIPVLRDFKYAKRSGEVVFVEAFEYLLETETFTDIEFCSVLEVVKANIERSLVELRRQPAQIKPPRGISSTPAQKMAWLEERTQKLITELYSR